MTDVVANAIQNKTGITMSMLSVCCTIPDYGVFMKYAGLAFSLILYFELVITVTDNVVMSTYGPILS